MVYNFKTLRAKAGTKWTCHQLSTLDSVQMITTTGLVENTGETENLFKNHISQVLPTLSLLTTQEMASTITLASTKTHKKPATSLSEGMALSNLNTTTNSPEIQAVAGLLSGSTLNTTMLIPSTVGIRTLKLIPLKTCGETYPTTLPEKVTKFISIVQIAEQAMSPLT
jgi:hypothetical protein